MARRSEGLKLEPRDSGAAARIYEAVVSGRWAPGRRHAAPVASMPFDEVAARWLAHIKPSIEAKTFRLYRDTYVGAHFAGFFKTIDQLTTVGAQDYIAARLRKVTRQALKHELSPLRRLARWAHARGYLPQMPEIETPGRRVLGTPVVDARKKVSFIFTEIAAVVARLPEYWSAPRAKVPYPVRARFIVAWETALRPRTLAQLEVPTDYRRGADTLHIRDEIDKTASGASCRSATRRGRRSTASVRTRASSSAATIASSCFAAPPRRRASTPTTPTASRTTTSATRRRPTSGAPATTCRA